MKRIRNSLLLFFNVFIIFLLCSCTYEMKQLVPSADSPTERPPFSVTFLDVGQADAAIIQCNGHYMMIDGGNKDDSNLVYRYLREHGISHFDLVIGTHADEDHIGGLAGAFHYADADLTLCSTDTYDSDAFRDFKTYATLRGNGIKIPNTGDIYSVGDASVEILSVNINTESNDSSIVAKIAYGDTSFLFTGDAEMETEQFLLNSAFDLDADVLKVAHHGSLDSTSESFIEHVNPQYAVISVGEDNTYGHPSDMILRRLKNANINILRTDLHGDIVFTSDGTALSCHSEYPDNSILPDPAADTYILNLRSKKFHLPTCDSISKMSVKNRFDFSGTRDEIMELGYAPCGGCKP